MQDQNHKSAWLFNIGLFHDQYLSLFKELKMVQYVPL